LSGSDRRRVEQVCHEALDRDAADRFAFVAAACGDDASLRCEVEALLAHAQIADGFLAGPVGAVAADVMSGSAPASWIGRRIGVYEVVSLLGAGGMGEVYRARDTQLGRDVAIKVLPPAFVADPERLARFEREARVLASLNHPHIGAIYGVESIAPSTDSGHAARALVLELVEGDTLADRLAKSGGSRHKSQGAELPVTEALTLARQIAEALEAAHEKGIVHRDLKPANIKITPNATVKVLDFGLAKAVTGGSGQAGADPSDAATLTLNGTQDGVLLGTAAYMSPEQARGQSVDKRTDIWAFGSVLYEMLTGRIAFPGSTVSDHIAAVLEREPEWTALPAIVPASIRRLLRRCLEKDSHRRLHDIADARIEIEDALAFPAAETTAVVATPLRLVVPAAIAALAVAIGVLYWTPRSTPSETVRFSVSVPGRLLTPYYIAMAPDGRQVAFVATDSSGRQLLGTATWDGREPRLIPGTEDAGHPFWSPDSHVVGFISGGGLKTVNVSGGPVHTVAAPAFRAGGTWNQDGIILFVQRLGRLATVSASGGAVSPVVVHDASGREVSGTFPRFLPDGRHFLFYSGNRFWEGAQGQQRGVYVGSLDSTSATYLSRTKFRAAYAPPGYLLFMRDDHALMAQPFDPRRLALTGDPALVAERVLGNESAGYNSLSVSSNGALAFVDQSIANTQLTWFDRLGHPLGTIGSRPVRRRDPATVAGRTPRGRRARARLERRHLAPGRVGWDQLAVDVRPRGGRDAPLVA
jgi:serine/threonine protein kinase